jgi:vacuole morphology and inheritance protein 14
LIRRADTANQKLPDLTLEGSERAVFIAENDDYSNQDGESALKDDFASEVDQRDTGGK